MNTVTRYAPSLDAKLFTCIVSFPIILLGVWMMLSNYPLLMGIGMLFIGFFLLVRGFFYTFLLRKRRSSFIGLSFIRLFAFCVSNQSKRRGENTDTIPYSTSTSMVMKQQYGSPHCRICHNLSRRSEKRMEEFVSNERDAVSFSRPPFPPNMLWCIGSEKVL